MLLANAQGQFTAIAAQWPTEQDGRDWSAESYQLVPEPAAESGDGGTLLMVPEQPGLPYERARFGTDGKLSAVSVVKSPPAGLFADAGGNDSAPGAEASLAEGMGAKTSTEFTPGALPGKFSVDRMGAASYRIPIAVAPGVNGMQPKLAINYNSGTGQTQLGLGWSLAGLSAISRCPATIATDGYSGPVDMSNSDRFCLGNAHLIAYPADVNKYGLDGSEYHTPVASFQRIISHETQGYGPASFTAETKSGLTREYGGTNAACPSGQLSNEKSGSRIQGGPDYDNTVAVWLLSKTTDRWGNFIDYCYIKTESGGRSPDADTSYRVSEIYYGNNAGTVLGKLLFQYDTLTPGQWRNTYLDGLEHVFRVLVKSITVESLEPSGSTFATLSNYNFTYANPWGSAQRLTSVTRCDAAGVCLKPTSFQYAPKISGFKAGYGIPMTATDTMTKLYLGDLDGDGRTDLLYALNGDWWYGTSAKESANVDTGIGAGPASGQAVVFDANDDGYSDLLFPVSGHQFELAEWNPSTNKLEDSGQRLNYLGGPEKPNPVAADVMGDGYPWVLFKSNNSLYYIENNGGTFGTPVDTGLAIGADQQVIPIRFRHGQVGVYIGGYGCPDSDPCASSEGVRTWNRTTSTFVRANANPPESGLVEPVDFNGDGLDGFLQWDGDGSGAFEVYTNEGGSFVSGSWTPASGAKPASSYFAVFDYTGDSRADVIYPAQDGTWYVISGPAGGLDGTTIETIATGITAPSGNVHPFDFAGKGEGGLLKKSTQPSNVSHWNALEHAGDTTGTHGGELTGITTGLGPTITIGYAALSWYDYGENGGLYSPSGATMCDTCAPGADAAAVRTFTAPLFVVKQISTSESPGTTLTTDYHYGSSPIPVGSAAHLTPLG
ncbi:MAG: SpvB/TcaC N-terminal domain-containing protein [Gammaproteobacteria bacterium]